MSQQDTFQQLVDTLRAELLQTLSTSTTNQATATAVPMANPKLYSGEANECKGFLLQCELIFEMQPNRFPTDRSKIAYMLSLLTGKALQWAVSIREQNGQVLLSYRAFHEHFQEVFGYSESDNSVCDELYNIQQGKTSAAEYSLRFRTLAAASGWDERALITTYRNGLNAELRLQLSAFVDTIGLERFIQRAISTENRMVSCRTSQTALTRPPEPSSPGPEPMQLDSTRIPLSERQRRITQGLCLYCASNEHHIADCPVRPSRALVSTIQPEKHIYTPLSANVKLSLHHMSVIVTALLDSGSAGNFISAKLCKQFNIKKEPITPKLRAQSITGTPLNRSYIKHKTCEFTLTVGVLHRETIKLLVLEKSTADVILGRPWLMEHHPELSWDTGEVKRWGDNCFPHCFPERPQPHARPVSVKLQSTAIESPKETVSVQIPQEYTDYKDVFCPKRASRLPPHRPWDCAIDLLPGEPVHKGKIYSLTLPEQEAMNKYISEALEQRYIRPSTSLLLLHFSL